MLPRIEILADPECERYGPCLVAQLTDGTELEWREHERANAYTLTWRAATKMTETLAREAGVVPALEQELADAVCHIRAAASVRSTIEAMEAACRSTREGESVQSRMQSGDL